ncbi:MAG: ABC transporter ATP-binding protein [Mycoplasmatales bacterium]|nr:ABC transporter ATP-binding protein [Mycoplasmatales bacterium]
MINENQINTKKAKPVIELVNLVKEYDEKVILKGLNIKIEKGQFITLLGPSGSGKTTALRLIAGFEKPTRGEIKMDGFDIKDLPAHKRPTKTIFQDYALFPNLNVEGNIKYGLKLLKIQKENVSEEKIRNLELRKQKWKKIADLKMKKLDKEQEEYQKILENDSVNSSKYKKARKWLDESDFKYSYWENYVDLKEESYKRKNTERFLTKQEMNHKVKEMIKLIGLEGNEKKSIDQLSGGMKQRVALARALVTDPEILLLDEPLSALDMKVRKKMQIELKAIQVKLGMTFIFVTHDQEEAMTMSDKIAVMRNGKIDQYDSPKQIYDYPNNSWVSSFIGDSTLFKGKYVKKGIVHFNNKNYKCENYEIKIGSDVDIMLRPEDFEFTTKTKSFDNGEIIKKTFQGAMWEYSIKNNNNKIISIKTNKNKKIGDTIYYRWNWEDLHVMERENESKKL